MRTTGVVIAVLGAVVFALGFVVKNFAVANLSLNVLGALLYSLGLYLFVVSYQKKEETEPNAIMITAMYATLWAYSLVTALSGELNKPFMTLLVLMLSVHSILLLIAAKSKLTKTNFAIFSTLIFVMATLVIFLL